MKQILALSLLLTSTSIFGSQRSFKEEKKNSSFTNSVLSFLKRDREKIVPESDTELTPEGSTESDESDFNDYLGTLSIDFNELDASNYKLIIYKRNENGYIYIIYLPHFKKNYTFKEKDKIENSQNSNRIHFTTKNGLKFTIDEQIIETAEKRTGNIVKITRIKHL